MGSNGNGWATIATEGSGLNLPGIRSTSDIQGVNGFFSTAIRSYGGGLLRVENTNSSAPFGSTGIGVEIFRDSSNGYIHAYDRSNSAWVPIVLQSETRISPAGTLSTTIDGNGVNLASGRVFKVNGTQVVGARQAAIGAPTGGTTIDAEARTAIGSILTVLRTHGLIAT